MRYRVRPCLIAAEICFRLWAQTFFGVAARREMLLRFGGGRRRRYGRRKCSPEIALAFPANLHFWGRQPFRHPPENAPAFPASFVFGDGRRLGTRRKMLLHFRHPSFSGTEGVWAPAGKCSCISGILRFRGRQAFRHPPENAPAFPAYRPSMAVKKNRRACALRFRTSVL